MRNIEEFLKGLRNHSELGEMRLSQSVSIRKAILEVDVGDKTLILLPKQQHQAGLVDFQPKFSIELGETKNQSLTFYNFEHVVKEKGHCKLILLDVRTKRIGSNLCAKPTN